VKAIIMSHALDTNGQNARYVKAAKKFGRDKAVLKALAIGKDDPAGVVGRYKLAADKYGGLDIRSVHKVSHYFDFPADILWTRKTEPLIRDLVEEADIIHLNNSYRPAQRFHVQKPMLLHHHGTLFRNNPEHMLGVARSRRMTQAVSTIDLQRSAPDLLHWLPSAYDIDALVAFGKKHQREPDGRVRIVHCPTNRALKHTGLFLSVVAELQTEGLPIDLELVENRTWEESLKAKARADILFDQLMFGYGCNSIEAWALGKPVITGADDWTEDRMQALWGGLPYYRATQDTLKDDVRLMVDSADLRSEVAAKGMAHIRRYHDERPALERLAELYAMSIVSYNGPRHASAAQAVRFRSKRTIRMDGATIAQKGEMETDDPYVITRLRNLAKRGVMGVEEIA
jgi:hypothetical protein